MLLQRAALVARATAGRPPDPLAGLKLDDADLAALLDELPGNEAAGELVREVEEAAAKSVTLAVERFLESLEGDDRFAHLVRRAGLTAGEAVLLAVLCAIEAEPRRQRLVAYLNDDVTARRATLSTLARVGQPLDTGLSALGPGGSLRRSGLVQGGADGPWATSPVAVAASVMWWLHGTAGPEPDLPAGLEFIGSAASAENRAGRSDRRAPRIAVAASPDRRRRLQAVAGCLDAARFLVVPGAPVDSAQWEAVVRQATLAGAGVIIDVEGDLQPAARDRIEATAHLPWGITSPVELPVAGLPAGWIQAPVERPQATDAEWEEAFGPGVPRLLPLTAEQVALAGRAAAASAAIEGPAAVRPGDPATTVADAVRRLAAGHIDATARRIRPSRTWDDLILDADRDELVRTVAMRCRQRRTVYEDWGFSPSPSRGVVALFAGPSGTGKTLAAEVIAGDLGVDLYAIDLANLVSKYIGETEKNLGRVFDAAEASNVALFFDEADALLGKRSAVSDAHDRYANIEVAYLLQRLERYDGLAIMATNLVNNLDPAFVRRLHVVVEFAMPGPLERLRIWQHCLPPQAPVSADLDLDALARHFELAGGTIRNAVLGAAFLAADAGTPITMAVALRSLQTELRKVGRLVSPADLSPFADHLG